PGVNFRAVITLAAVLGSTVNCSDRVEEKPAKAPAASTPTPAAPTSTSTTSAPTRTSPVASSEVTTKPAFNGPLKAPFTRTTLSGIYTAEEAKEGSVLYMGYCQSCHAAVSHTGPEFRLKWAGRPLSDLYDFMHTN